jgi:hypothetical protein
LGLGPISQYLDNHFTDPPNLTFLNKLPQIEGYQLKRKVNGMIKTPHLCILLVTYVMEVQNLFKESLTTIYLDQTIAA